jgi:hypothetical protein
VSGAKLAEIMNGKKLKMDAGCWMGEMFIFLIFVDWILIADRCPNF